MARPLRIEYEGALYHVMSRGDRREAIFRDEADREEFLRSLGQVCGKTGWQVHAYCLMSNHFHLVLETPQPNLAVGMKRREITRGPGVKGLLMIPAQAMAWSRS